MLMTNFKICYAYTSPRLIRSLFWQRRNRVLKIRLPCILNKTFPLCVMPFPSHAVFPLRKLWVSCITDKLLVWFMVYWLLNVTINDILVIHVTPHFSRLLRRAWGYGGRILILNPRVPTREDKLLTKLHNIHILKYLNDRIKYGYIPWYSTAVYYSGW